MARRPQVLGRSIRVGHRYFFHRLPHPRNSRRAARRALERAEMVCAHPDLLGISSRRSPLLSGPRCSSTSRAFSSAWPKPAFSLASSFTSLIGSPTGSGARPFGAGHGRSLQPRAGRPGLSAAARCALAGSAGWKWLFILEGLPAVLLGIVTLIWMTDRPRDRAMAHTGERDYLEGVLADEARARRSAGSASLWKVFRLPKCLAARARHLFHKHRRICPGVLAAHHR